MIISRYRRLIIEDVHIIANIIIAVHEELMFTLIKKEKL